MSTWPLQCVSKVQVTDISAHRDTYIDVSILSSAELNVAIVRFRLSPSNPSLLHDCHLDTLAQATTNLIKQISASIPAMISLFRRLMGKRNTTKGSSGTPGTSGTPGLSSGLSSGNQSKKKASRDRWHGFTDVFSTRATTTLVASHPRSHADYSNDEFELLEDPVVHEPGSQAMDSNGHSNSSGQETYHTQNMNYNGHSPFSNQATSYAQNSEYNGHTHYSNQEAYHAQHLHQDA